MQNTDSPGRSGAALERDSALICVIASGRETGRKSK